MRSGQCMSCSSLRGGRFPCEGVRSSIIRDQLVGNGLLDYERLDIRSLRILPHSLTCFKSMP